MKEKAAEGKSQY